MYFYTGFTFSTIKVGEVPHGSANILLNTANYIKQASRKTRQSPAQGYYPGTPGSSVSLCEPDPVFWPVLVNRDLLGPSPCLH